MTNTELISFLCSCMSSKWYFRTKAAFLWFFLNWPTCSLPTQNGPVVHFWTKLATNPTCMCRAMSSLWAPCPVLPCFSCSRQSIRVLGALFAGDGKMEREIDGWIFAVSAVEALDLPVNLRSNLHLWLWGLAIDRKEGGGRRHPEELRLDLLFLWVERHWLSWRGSASD